MSREPLPPPLPPETRTVGQLVAESIRLYGDHVAASLLLGISLVIVNQVSAGRTTLVQAVILAAGAPLMSASYVGATAIAADVRPSRREGARAIAIGSVVWLPVAFLALLFVLPAIAWLAVFGLVVPVTVLERPAAGDAFRRAIELARADFPHALGSLATLVILFALVKLTLAVLLHDLGDSEERVALGLADLVVSPLLFLGSALLYFDQAARVRSSPLSE